MSVSDWPHQSYAVSECTRLIEEGQDSLCLTSPTGGGKSRILQRLIEWAVQDKLWRCVVLSSRRLLTNQLAHGLNKAGVHVGVRAADFESWTDLSAPVQICSVQTEVARVLNKREEDRRRFISQEECERRHKLHPAEIVFIDEVHMQCGDSVMALVSEYREKYGAVVIGITATPLGVSHLCDQLVVAGNNSSLRACGALVPASCFEPSVIDLPKIRKSRQEIFTQAELDRATKQVWTQHIVGHIYDGWKRLNPDARPGLGMAPGVKESLGLAMDFHKRGVNAAHIDGESIYVDGEHYRTHDQQDRDELFEKMRDGSVPICFNRYVLREAIDLPWLEYLCLATPIASVLSYIQVVGRTLRASPGTGKTKAIIADHAGNIRTHGNPNLDRDQDWQQYFYEDEHKLARDRQDFLRDPEKKEPEPITCPECGKMRPNGPICPQCGYEHKLSVRKVIQEPGHLQKVTGDVFPRRKTKMKPDTIDAWKNIYYRMRNARKPKSFRQALALFKYENHYEPPRDLPLMPLNHRDFSRKIQAVPYEQLHQLETTT